MKMYSLRIVLHRNLPQRAKNLTPKAAFWRSQKTEASLLEKDGNFGDSAKLETEDCSVRPFEEIPGPKASFLKYMVDFYAKTEGFRKGYKLTDLMFVEHGPIYKENMMLGSPTVHAIDPDDFEKVFRAEGKYPRRVPIDIWIEHRKRRNYFPGAFLS